MDPYKPAKSFDVHLASDVISPPLESRLLTLGFVRDAFIGGTEGVVHPCHYSCHPVGRTLQLELWTAAIDVLSDASPTDFHGYAEAEVTPPGFRVELAWKAFDPTVPFPLGRFQYEDCPLELHKDFDIHVTADTASIDPRLQRLLEDEINFNFVEIRKSSGRVVRVYTFQPLGPSVTHDVFGVLLRYFQQAGGFDGKIKLEVCTHFARFPSNAACCPIIRRLSPAAAGLT